MSLFTHTRHLQRLTILGIIVALFTQSCMSDKNDMLNMDLNSEAVIDPPTETTHKECTDSKDNDLDGFIDCDDTDCYGIAECIPEYLCDDEEDNDDDGEEDCEDPDCFYTEVCFKVSFENTYDLCSDEEDNDDNGRVDCNDPSCSRFDFCIENTDDFCNDTIDNDGDDLIDCDDPGCNGKGDCSENSDETCRDGIDNDADDDIDCQDKSCAFVGACLPELVCDDKEDNDFDNRIDCEDSDCNFHPACVSHDLVENTFDLCEDGEDNDLDNKIDCEDSDCLRASNCQENTNAACDDGIDNDFDGDIDCDDDECLSQTVCSISTDIQCIPDGYVAPTTLDLKLTVYDHESIEGTPFWYLGCPDEWTRNMVQDTLGANGRPLMKIDTCANAEINTWWTDEGAISVKDTLLTFSRTTGSTYQYKTDKMGFFPAGGCEEGTGGGNGSVCKGTPNYGFAAHMQRKFLYIREGADEQTFDFSGDDDVFVFLNGHLVLDIGGIHNPIQKEFYLQTEADNIGLTNGDTAVLDFFIAERRRYGSQAQITMNIECLIAAAFDKE